jgi:hypothetical protein
MFRNEHFYDCTCCVCNHGFGRFLGPFKFDSTICACFSYLLVVMLQKCTVSQGSMSVLSRRYFPGKKKVL